MVNTTRRVGRNPRPIRAARQAPWHTHQEPLEYAVSPRVAALAAAAAKSLGFPSVFPFGLRSRLCLIPAIPIPVAVAVAAATKTSARATSSAPPKRDPIYVDGHQPRPMYVDYKDLDLLSKLTNRHGRIVSRRKTGCHAASQHAVARAIKRARFMALLPYVGD